MKTTKMIGLVLCALCVGLTSCNKDPEYFDLTSYPDQMHLSASVQEMTLVEDKANDLALVLSWNKVVSPISPSDRVYYKVCFYPTINKAEHSKYIDTEATELRLTHNELNSIIARWAIPGEPIKVTAQVLSVVENEQKYVKPQLSTAEIVVTGWEKYPQFIYLVMKVDDETVTSSKMEQREMGTGVYELTLDLKPCDFYFKTNASLDYPVYNMAPEGDGEQMEFIVQGNFTPFKNTETGQRTVIVDVNSDYNDCRILDIVQLPMPGHMWIAGDGCSVGWKENSPAGQFTMVGGEREPWLYAWTGDFYPPQEKTDEHDATEGKFKIGLGQGFGDDCFFAPEADTDPLKNKTLPMYRKQGSDDWKWLVSKEAAGRHTITISLLRNDMYMKFE